MINGDSRLVGSLLIYANRINADDEAIVRVLGSAPRAHQLPNISPLGVTRWLLAATYRLIALKTKPCAYGRTQLLVRYAHAGAHDSRRSSVLAALRTCGRLAFATVDGTT